MDILVIMHKYAFSEHTLFPVQFISNLFENKMNQKLIGCHTEHNQWETIYYLCFK